MLFDKTLKSMTSVNNNKPEILTKLGIVRINTTELIDTLVRAETEGC